ncbi:MAG: type II secretion system F family protein, partial [Cyclobacteriaceae bacterium]|nr:type II secretion system F family protein [Cyclobacteriaceae bacterium HetDA_MAG_MS6]
MKLKELEAIAAPTKPEKQQTESIWNKDIQLFGSKLTDKDKSNFYQQLYTLITAGVDISTSLQHIVKQAGKKQVTKIVNEILDNIMKGSSLSSALQETGAFTNYEVYSIQIGEESGELAEVLQNLFDYLEEKIGQRREIISALSYPILIITSAIGAVLFMIFFIIPVFEEIFMRFGGELPGLTQQVIDFSVWLRTNAWSAIISILVIV